MASFLSLQAPAAVVMVRLHRFTPNPKTAADNSFRSEPRRARPVPWPKPPTAR